ncbi:hypothetical protein J1N09_07190 [Aureitalea sp. L0-47]|uniref:hypothetical protein n=1 Tax=Aureitalea sp. L0-47 TaxID=2816962 RepID=UPI002238CBA6|nr:hypothetical protein [Aureitalea sp. L0-47]MCW5519616.1 hypothetical protein [Aureitalea sp. L0-47]
MIYILSGDIETGKSTALLDWAKDRQDCYGILSPGNAPGERYFLDISNKREFRMEAGSGEEDAIEVGRFRFLRSAFSKANAILKKATDISEGIIIIDELGKLELRDEGLFESAKLAVKKATENEMIDLILVVRTSLLDQVVSKYGIDKYTLISKEYLKDFPTNCNNSYIAKF